MLLGSLVGWLVGWFGWVDGWRVVLHVLINIQWIDTLSPGQSISIRPMSPSVGLRSIQLGSFKRKKLSAWGCTPSRFFFTYDRHQANWTQGWSYTSLHVVAISKACTLQGDVPRGHAFWECWCCTFRCRDQPEVPLQGAESFSS